MPHTPGLRLWPALVLCLLSACGKADVSAARHDYIAAHDHATLAVTVDTPAPAGATLCRLGLRANGEPFLDETLFPNGGAAPRLRSGFQFTLPTGPQQLAATLECDKQGKTTATLAATLGKDTLTALAFDGKALKADAPQPYLPATLATVGDDVNHLAERHDAQSVSQLAALERLTRWQMGGTAGAVVLALVALWVARRHK